MEWPQPTSTTLALESDPRYLGLLEVVGHGPEMGLPVVYPEDLQELILWPFDQGLQELPLLDQAGSNSLFARILREKGLRDPPKGGDISRDGASSRILGGGGRSWDEVEWSPGLNIRAKVDRSHEWDVENKEFDGIRGVNPINGRSR